MPVLLSPTMKVGNVSVKNFVSAGGFLVMAKEGNSLMQEASVEIEGLKRLNAAAIAKAKEQAGQIKQLEEEKKSSCRNKLKILRKSSQNVAYPRVIRKTIFSC